MIHPVPLPTLPLFILMGTLLAVNACSERDVKHVEKLVEREGIKLAKQVGKKLLKPSASTSGVPSDPATIPDLVTSKNAVGHRDFVHAKKVLPDIFSGELKEEFYCGCAYTGKDMDLASCGYVPRKNPNRAARLEWEHIVPAWEIGHQRQCWQNGGRRNCTATDSVFQVAEGDLNNLVPSIGEVNGDRSNFPYGAWDCNPTLIYGACTTVVGFRLKRAQPREEVRGRAARVTLYMHARYGLALSKQDRQLMCAWAKTYPVDSWEVERDRRIVSIQSEGNPLVENPASINNHCTKS